MMKQKERKAGKNTHTPRTFPSSGTGRVSQQKGALLQEFRHTTGNKPCTEEPAVDKGAETDRMEEAQ